ncbi:ABC transporter substrate-binding protein [Alicycliphilus sp. B1]|nr:ABC transporter substrate-binding protein [Alicycliphilus sp. B1]
MNGKKFDTGELVKAEFPNKLPTGFQSYVLNTRRPLLADRRVREALGLAFDFEWMSRQLFYGAYQRVHGIFGNTMCETHGNPTPAELALLEPWRKELPPEVFGPHVRAPGHQGRDGAARAPAPRPGAAQGGRLGGEGRGAAQRPGRALRAGVHG